MTLGGTREMHPSMGRHHGAPSVSRSLRRQQSLSLDQLTGYRHRLLALVLELDPDYATRTGIALPCTSFRAEGTL